MLLHFPELCVSPSFSLTFSLPHSLSLLLRSYVAICCVAIYVNLCVMHAAIWCISLYNTVPSISALMKAPQSSGNHLCVYVSVHIYKHINIHIKLNYCFIIFEIDVSRPSFRNNDHPLTLFSQVSTD